MYLLPTEVPTLDFQVKVAITDFSYSLGPQGSSERSSRKLFPKSELDVIFSFSSFEKIRACGGTAAQIHLDQVCQG